MYHRLCRDGVWLCTMDDFRMIHNPLQNWLDLEDLNHLVPLLHWTWIIEVIPVIDFLIFFHLDGESLSLFNIFCEWPWQLVSYVNVCSSRWIPKWKWMKIRTGANHVDKRICCWFLKTQITSIRDVFLC